MTTVTHQQKPSGEFHFSYGREAGRRGDGFASVGVAKPANSLCGQRVRHGTRKGPVQVQLAERVKLGLSTTAMAAVRNGCSQKLEPNDSPAAGDPLQLSAMAALRRA